MFITMNVNSTPEQALNALFISNRFVVAHLDVDQDADNDGSRVLNLDRDNCIFCELVINNTADFYLGCSDGFFKVASFASYRDEAIFKKNMTRFVFPYHSEDDKLTVTYK